MRLQEAFEFKVAAEEAENRSFEYKLEVEGVVVDLEKQRLAIEQERVELMNEQRYSLSSKAQSIRFLMLLCTKNLFFL